MSKLSYGDKVEIYDKRKDGVTLKTLYLQYGIIVHNIQYIIWLVDKYGYKILKKKSNKEYNK
jgi:transposase